jgi:hypothetical protein
LIALTRPTAGIAVRLWIWYRYAVIEFAH